MAASIKTNDKAFFVQRKTTVTTRSDHAFALVRSYHVSYVLDTDRTVQRSVKAVFDTNRHTGNHETCLADTRRWLTAHTAVTNLSDTARIVGLSQLLGFSTSRVLKGNITDLADTDREIKIPFRYDNPGYKERLIFPAHNIQPKDQTQSKTGYAFYIGNDHSSEEKETGIFPIPATNEFWFRFDVYSTEGTSNRWRAYNGYYYKKGIAGSTGSYGNTGSRVDGITRNEDNILTFAYDKQVHEDKLTWAGLHQVCLHMIAGKANKGALIEYWYDGAKITAVTDKDVGPDDFYFRTIYLQSDGSDVFFSNIIISSDPLEPTQDCKNNERQWLMPMDITSDTVSKWGIDDLSARYSDPAYTKNYPILLCGGDLLYENIYCPIQFCINTPIDLKHFTVCFQYSYTFDSVTDVGITLSYSDDAVNWTPIQTLKAGKIPYIRFSDGLGSHKYYQITASDYGHNLVDGFIFDARPVEIVGFDTSRNLQRSEQLHADTDRLIGVGTARSADFDTRRAVGNFYKVSFDTIRSQGYREIFADTHRTLNKSTIVGEDTVRRIPFDLFGTKEPVFEPQSEFTPFPKKVVKGADKGVISFTLTLEENTLSDKISADVIGFDYWPGDILKGKFIDYPYEMKIESTQNTGARQSISAMHYKDRLLYTGMKYDSYRKRELNRSRNASYAYMLRAQWYVNRIKESLSLHVDARFSNFTPESDFSDTDITYADLLSGLFGWTSQYPWRLVNVFLRGQTLYILQRGRETKVYDITDLPHTEPEIERSIYYSPYASNNRTNTSSGGRTKIQQDPDQDEKDKEKEQPDDSEYKNPNDDDTDKTEELRFNGVIYGDHIKQTYWDGLCVEEVHYIDEFDPDGKKHQKVDVVVTRDYDGNDQCTKERSDNADGTWRETNTSYAYGGTGSHSHTEDGDQYGVTQTTDVYTAFLGGSFTGTSTYVDGQFVSSSISGSGIINRTLPYTQNQQNAGLQNAADSKKKEEEEEEEQRQRDLANAKTDPYIPTVDHSIRKQIQSEIDAYDRSIQETVTLDIIMPVISGKPKMTHIIDFTERIRFNGAEYYLVRNTVRQDVTSLKQSIEITRWIKR